MIVPTRFGLKYTPIPTLALEYEDNLNGAVDATGENPADTVKKLHVVELPKLTRTSETEQILRQLQKENDRFLASDIVNEDQLKRLLDRLVENLPGPATSVDEERQPSPVESNLQEQQDQHDVSGSEFEESAMDESVMEASAIEESAAEASQSESHEIRSRFLATTEEYPNRGMFLSQDVSDHEESHDKAVINPTSNNVDTHDEAEHSDEDNTGKQSLDASITEEQKQEAEEDARKTKALRSESDISEEEVYSEDLEYFSEDGSDEDSF